MKKIIAGLMIGAMTVGSLFAVDFAARVYMTGSALTAEQNSDDNGEKTDGFAISGPQLWEQEQQDADALVLSFNGEKAGAKFQLWYCYNGDTLDGNDVTIDSDTDTDEIVRARSIALWFKPFDFLKINMGDISHSTYTERLHWWKDAVGNSLVQAWCWGDGSRWSNYASCEGSGLSVEYTPIDKLYVNLACIVDPEETGEGINVNDGSGTFTYNTTDSDSLTYLGYGAILKYQVLDNLSVAIAYRDQGGTNVSTDTDDNNCKILSVGADFGNWGTPYYGFLNARMFFDDNNGGETYWGTLQVYRTAAAAADAEDTAMKLRGVCFDNYFSYKVDAFTIQECCPVTIRLSGEENDPSYMTFDVKASYALDGFTPYIEIMDNDYYTPITFDEYLADNFGITFKPGVSVNVGECALDVAVQIDYENATTVGGDHLLRFAIPFTASVAF